MSIEESGQSDRNEYTVSTRFMELVTAGLFMIGGVIVMWDSYRTGIGWAMDGPEAGYFPFFCALIMFVAASITFITNVITKVPDHSNFVERTGLKLIMVVLVPTIVYVWVMSYIGIYVSSAIFIGAFMIFLGKYPLHITIPVAVGVPAFMFAMFEIWFLVPLPKGPLENWLGY